MFILNDDLSIYATRGDMVFFSVTAEQDGKNHTFMPGDVVRIKVYGKKDAETVVLQKDFPVARQTETVEIILTEEDTKIGEVISKPKDYWYEVELNPLTNPQTIIGYDEDGAKVFKLFPEGNDIPEYVPEQEEIPAVDEELDMTSPRPVQNRAIAGAIAGLRAGLYLENEHYAGCYSRAVGVETEWLNPPMELGREYRTAQRYKNKPVYVKRFVFDRIPGGAAGDTTDNGCLVDFPANATVLSLEGVHRTDNGTTPLPEFDGNGACVMHLAHTASLHIADPAAYPTHHIALYTRGYESPVLKDSGEYVEATVRYTK